ncbi:peptidase S8 [Candidatus Chloroploca sp. M-50]|uniref:Peptidase S8 n=1 Tax=Candidatus Chloroploca mongolica TaxID=2528176 RepID=A0ABS4DH84_9CHLR|nr:S8 family peptidase [Candidatus Chloroploca mongolica]MBP1468791.1 peptidase S8 [Candidatus Chloroploca mongolica]
MDYQWFEPGTSRIDSGSLVRIGGKPVQLTINDPRFNEQWGLAKINAYDAWFITQGSPDITIAIIDTGVELAHDDLKQKVNTVDDYNFPANTDEANDESGHGTHVAGIVAAETNNQLGIAGVCPRCEILPLRVFDAPGQGAAIDNIANAIKYAADKEARVINLSLGYAADQACSQTLADAINYAYEKGVVIVAASGNACPVDVAFGRANFSVAYPARFDRVIAVGASNPNDTRASFSSYDAMLDLVAPGQGILSTYLNNSYKSLDGTSMASPMVAGVVGLMLSRDASLSPAKVAEILRTSVTDLGTSGFDQETGWGLLNASQALLTTVSNIADLPPAACPVPAEVPQAMADPQTDQLFTIYRSLRDTVLAQSALGQKYLAIYYEQAPTLASILLTHDDLRTRTATFLQNAADEFSALLPSSTQSVMLSQELYDEANALVRDLAGAGGSSFASDITTVWQELHLDAQVGSDVKSIWNDLQPDPPPSQSSVYLPVLIR